MGLAQDQEIIQKKYFVIFGLKHTFLGAHQWGNFC